MEYLSTTGLAKEMDVPTNELFAKLKGRQVRRSRNSMHALAGA